jgi:hypothetical protein
LRAEKPDVLEHCDEGLVDWVVCVDSARPVSDRMTSLPDQAHIERIKNALWQGGEFGRAAVMVGAGLSLNARPISASAPSFPTWKALTGRMVDDLYPEHLDCGGSRQEALDQSASTSGALRLADEYKAAFGRDALDRLMLAAVPDSGYEPCGLHSLLLELPWSDVFTTNYDTLLERAARNVLERKYDIVRTQEDIPGSNRPRIIKLHGSFPSNRPFIISEEDFRTYPRLFAPFVNLAQESMMENAFCLIGFSGDDPNFLHWSGWVRDNLGPNSPIIYLCGALRLTDARRKLLAERNVVPIDLSPLVQGDTRNPHGVALEWFLRALGERKWWPTPNQWPYRESESKIHAPLPPGLPPTPRLGFPSFSNEKTYPPGAGERLHDEIIAQLLASWATSRESYPGWVVAPAAIRDRVWGCTEWWVDPLLERQNDLPFGGLLRILYELNWRLSLCLVPLTPDLASAIASCIERINPFADRIAMPGAGLSLDDASLELPDQNALRQLWLELAVALLRFCRESQDIKRFDAWAACLEPLLSLIPGLHSRIYYQRCLLALGRLDHQAVQSHLSAWSSENDDPFWLSRQAAILVELGDLVEASRRAEAGLAGVRAGLRPGAGEIGALSREGWAMKVVLVARQAMEIGLSATDQTVQELARDFRGRWRSLAGVDCDPDQELRLVKERLKRTKPVPTPQSKTYFAFDLGDVRASFRAGGPGLLSDLLPAVQAIRLLEEAGCPLRCSAVKLNEDEIGIAVSWLRDFYPTISTSYLLRLADSHLLPDHFSRNLIAVLPEGEISDLHDMLTKHLDYGLAVLTHSDAAARSAIQEAERKLLAICVQLLAMIVFRLPQATLLSELRRAIRFYQSPVFMRGEVDSSSLERLFARLMRSLVGLSDGQMRALAFELLSLPIPGVDGFAVYMPPAWPEPSRHLQRFSLKGARESDPTHWKQLVERLLQLTMDERGQARFVASLRLALLWEKDLLDAEESAHFSSALWAQRGPQSGLPASMAISYAQLLILPEPAAGLSVRLIKRYCLKTPFAPVRQTVSLPNGRTVQSVVVGADPGIHLDLLAAVSLPNEARAAKRRPRSVRLNEHDRIALFETFDRWWRNEGKAALTERRFPMITDPMRDRYHLIIRATRTALLPHCRPGDDLSSNIRRFVLDADSVGLPTLAAILPLTRLFPTMRREMVPRVRTGLLSRDAEQSGEAMGALYLWATETNSLGIASPPAELLLNFSALISQRVRSSLFWALTHACNMIRKSPGDVGRKILPNCVAGLGFLLEESSYRRAEDLEKSPFSPDEIPHIRFRSAWLAVTINGVYHSGDPVIERWMTAIATDPLPEVRGLIRGIDFDLDL